MTGLIDTHVHLWDPSRLRYDWLKQEPTLNRPFKLQDFQQAVSDTPVAGFVFVQCQCDPTQSLDEIDWVLDHCKHEPRLVGIVAQAAVEQGKLIAVHLDKLASRHLIRGVRRLIESESDSAFCSRPSFIEGVREVGRRGLSFDLCLTPMQLPSAITLVSQCPDVRFCLDHCGKPEIKTRATNAWQRDLKLLANQPNVCCKISGLLTEASIPWSIDEIRPFVEHAIECFGWKRVLFGSDWPVVTLAGRYASWFKAISQIVAACSPEERSLLFSGNAKSFYRLDSRV